MEYVTLKEVRYGFVSNFKHHKDIRASFNALAEATFGISFEAWYTSGYWGDNYIPYALVDKDKVVANVSVSKIEFLIDNEKKVGLQIGTVMTDEAYRHRGLSKFLMEQVINDWQEQADFIYLFANDSVLDFYPKFNFEVVEEYQYTKSLDISNPSSSLRKLDIDNDQDKELLVEALNDSLPIARISMRHNTSLLMFYFLSFKKNSIYYLENVETVVIADFESDTLILHDVFSKEPVNLEEVIQSVAGKGIKRVVFGFTPLNEKGYSSSLLQDGDTLFVLKDGAEYLKNNYWRFPVLSRA